MPSIDANRDLDPKELSVLGGGRQGSGAARYDTANGLAREVDCYLRDEPFEARPPSTSYGIPKFARANRAAFTAAMPVLIAILLGIVVSTTQAIRATRVERLNQTRPQAKTEARNDAEAARQAEPVQVF